MDVNKTSESKECDICHYWYFLDKGFKVQPDVCIGCHDILMMFMNLIKIATLNNNGVDLCCIINKISKNEVISLLKNVDLIEKSGI